MLGWTLPRWSDSKPPWDRPRMGKKKNLPYITPHHDLIQDLGLTVIAGTSSGEQVGSDILLKPATLPVLQTGSLGLCKAHNSPSDCKGVWVTRFLPGCHQGLFHFHSKLLCRGEPTDEPTVAESTQLCCSLGCT